MFTVNLTSPDKDKERNYYIHFCRNLTLALNHQHVIGNLWFIQVFGLAEAS